MICWLNPVTGLAGDMFLAGLIDAGAPVDAIRAAIEATGLTGWELVTERVSANGLMATRVTVHVTDTATTRHAAELIELAGRAGPAADLAVRALRAIAETEAALHGTDPDSVHLHELGGHDTVVDVVGVAAALHALGVTEVYSTPLPLGTGTVHTAHGVLPSPAPATLALLTGATTTGTDLRGETVTPTAAALIRALPARFDRVPDMRPVRTGYGAGHRQLADRPNVVSVTLAEPAAAPSRVVVVLETTVDDVTGETLAHTVSRVLAAGALDAWLTAVTMKKGRPGHVLTVLAPQALAAELSTLVLAETGSLGLRRSTVDREVLARRMSTVSVAGHDIRVKLGPHGAKPEHDDVAAAAAALGLPLREVAERARRELR